MVRRSQLYMDLFIISQIGLSSCSNVTYIMDGNFDIYIHYNNSMPGGRPIACQEGGQ